MGTLVRDNIPDLIRTSGRTPIVRMLDADGYLAALHDKLLVRHPLLAGGHRVMSAPRSPVR